MNANKKITIKLTTAQLRNLLGAVNSQEVKITKLLKKDPKCEGYKQWAKEMCDLWVFLYDTEKELQK